MTSFLYDIAKLLIDGVSEEIPAFASASAAVAIQKWPSVLVIMYDKKMLFASKKKIFPGRGIYFNPNDFSVTSVLTAPI